MANDLLKNKNFTILAISGIAYLALRVFKNVPMDTESIIYYAGAILITSFLASKMKPFDLTKLGIALAVVPAIFLGVQIYMFNIPFATTQIMSVIEQVVVGLVIGYLMGVRK